MAKRVLVLLRLSGCLEPASDQTIGPLGGTARFDGVSLVFPPHALEREVVLTASKVTLPASAPAAAGPAFQFGPDDVVFKAPVELRLRLDDPAARAIILTAPSTAGSWQQLATRGRRPGRRDGIGRRRQRRRRLGRRRLHCDVR